MIEKASPSMLSRRHFVSAGAALVGAGALARPARADDNVIRIGYLQSLSPLNSGRLRGTLDAAVRQHGYRIEWSGPFPAFAPAVEALTPGSIDITEGSATSAASAMRPVA